MPTKSKYNWYLYVMPTQMFYPDIDPIPPYLSTATLVLLFVQIATVPSTKIWQNVCVKHFNNDNPYLP